MGERRVEIVSGVYEAFGRGDVRAVLGALSDEFEWYEAERTGARTALGRR